MYVVMRLSALSLTAVRAFTLTKGPRHGTLATVAFVPDEHHRNTRLPFDLSDLLNKILQMGGSGSSGGGE